MSGEPKRIAIGLIWHEGKVLVGVRPEGVPLAGYDEFPGGKCNPGEDPESAVVRECLEETGLAVVVRKLRLRTEYQYEHNRVDLHFFDCEIAGGVIAPPPPFRWATKAEVATLRFPIANLPVLTSIADGRV